MTQRYMQREKFRKFEFQKIFLTANRNLENAVEKLSKY